MTVNLRALPVTYRMYLTPASVWWAASSGWSRPVRSSVPLYTGNKSKRPPNDRGGGVGLS